MQCVCYFTRRSWETFDSISINVSCVFFTAELSCNSVNTVTYWFMCAILSVSQSFKLSAYHEDNDIWFILNVMLEWWVCCTQESSKQVWGVAVASGTWRHAAEEWSEGWSQWTWCTNSGFTTDLFVYAVIMRYTLYC